MWNVGNWNMQFKEQNFNFPNNYILLYFTEDNEYAISKYDKICTQLK